MKKEKSFVSSDISTGFYSRFRLKLIIKVDDVVIATKRLQDRNINIIAGTTVENKGKLILTD